MKEEYLNFIIDEKLENKEQTHIINVSSAISYFPTLMENIIYAFDNCFNDKEILEFFEDKIVYDKKLRKLLVCSLLYAEKYEKETLQMILEKYIINKKYENEIKETSFKHCDKENFIIANLLLYDYYIYLKTGIYDGIITNI